VGLPQANRLKRWQDFQTVYQQGSRYSSPHLLLRALPVVGGVNATQIGVSVSKKVSKKAVVRNRLKRQVRAAIRPLLPYLVPGWKVIFTVRPQAVGCKSEHFLRELKQLLTKAEILHGHSRNDIL
jgi:ribonuclease P protein component